MALKRGLVACDKFKGSLTARQVRDAVVAGFEDAGLAAEGVLVADGGDGTLDAVMSAGFALEPVTVQGPTGQPVTTGVARRGGVAVVELADACGLNRLPRGRLAPLAATSFGLGQAIRAALAATTTERLIVGAGGSASSDGGIGMIAGLGGALRDATGLKLPPTPESLASGVTLDLAPIRPLLAGREIVLASDVAAPLVGHAGAVAVFGPQKGLTGQDAVDRERRLEAWADLVAATCGCDLRDRPGAGAAGGVGFAAAALLGARLVPGVDLVLELTGFREAVSRATLVVTGEGLLDAQTLLGKTVAGVARAARAAGVPTVALCGASHITPSQARTLGLARVYPLTDLEPDPVCSLHDADRLVRATARRVALHHLDSLV